MAYYDDNRRDDRGRYGREGWENTRQSLRERFTAARDDGDDNYWDDDDGYGIRARGYQSGSEQNADYGGRDDMRDRRYSQSGTAYGRNAQDYRSTERSYGDASYSGPGYDRERQQYGARGEYRNEAGSAERGGYGRGDTRYTAGQTSSQYGGQTGGQSGGQYGQAHGHGGGGYGGNYGTYGHQPAYGAGARQQYADRGTSTFTGQQNSWAVPSSFGGRESRYGADYREHGYDSDRSGGEWSNSGERGFFARVGDEVASWFGDEDAARRREADHRGRGPSNYMRSDDRIREDANDRLTDDPRVDASHVDVVVASGEITLNGTVSTRAEKRHAEDAVEAISGVRHVQNNLRVQDQRAHTSGQGGASATGGSFGAMSGATSPSATATGASTSSTTASPGAVDAIGTSGSTGSGSTSASGSSATGASNGITNGNGSAAAAKSTAPSVGKANPAS